MKSVDRCCSSFEPVWGILGRSGPFCSLLSRSGSSWALSRSNLIPLRFHYENHNSRLIPVLELAEAMRCCGNVRNNDRHAYQASGVLRKWPNPRQARLSGILAALETSETLTGMLIRRLGCSRKRPKPWQEGLSDASRHILGASDVVLEISETPAGMLIGHFAFPLGCASGSF